MQYCRSLAFEEQPNYGYLRDLFGSLYNKCCFEHDYIFDWTVQRYRLDLPDDPLTQGNEEEQKTSTLPDSLRGQDNEPDELK